MPRHANVTVFSDVSSHRKAPRSRGWSATRTRTRSIVQMRDRHPLPRRKTNSTAVRQLSRVVVVVCKCNDTVRSVAAKWPVLGGNKATGISQAFSAHWRCLRRACQAAPIRHRHASIWKSLDQVASTLVASDANADVEASVPSGSVAITGRAIRE